MAGLIDSFMQGYINRVNAQNGGGRAANNTLAAQNTASAFQRLQDAISQDYSQQQAQAKASGQEWKMPSPTERFNDQVQAMILSGDPALQERGLALMTPDAMDKPTDFQRNFEYLKQANPNLSEMEYFKMLHPGPASTNVRVNIPKQEQMVSIEDSQKIFMPDGSHPPIGMTYSDVARLGGRSAETSDQSKAGQATDTLGGSMKVIRENINASPTPVGGAVTALRTQPGIMGQVINTVANVAGVPMKQTDVQFQNATRMATGQVTNLMNGAGASEGERDYWATLQPLPTDDQMTRRVKFNQQNDFIRNMTERARARGVQVPEYKVENLPIKQPSKPSAPQAPQAPKAAQTRTTKSGVTYTVEK